MKNNKACCRTLRFRVVDEGGNGLPDVGYFLQTVATNEHYKSGVSDSDGCLCFPCLAVGEYVLREESIPPGIVHKEIQLKVTVKPCSVRIDGCCRAVTIHYEREAITLLPEIPPTNEKSQREILVDLLKVLGNFTPYGEIITSIFDLFTDGSTHFTELYEMLKILIHDELSQNTVDTLNGQINGVISYIKTVYNPRKQQAIAQGTLNNLAVRQDLSQMLLTQLNNLFLAYGQLRELRYAKLGFPTYMVVATQILLIMQEMTTVDPLTLTPSESSYAQSIKDFAAEALAYGKQLSAQIGQERKDQIVIYSDYQGYGGCPYYRVWDKFIPQFYGRFNCRPYGFFQCDCDSAKNGVNNYLAKIQNDVQTALFNSWGLPEWLQMMELLKTNPLPTA